MTSPSWRVGGFPAWTRILPAGFAFLVAGWAGVWLSGCRSPEERAAGNYALRVEAAARAVQEHDPVRAERHLEAADPELRGWEWWHLRDRLDQSEGTWRAPEGRVVALDWGDGRELLSLTASPDDPWVHTLHYTLWRHPDPEASPRPVDLGRRPLELLRDERDLARRGLIFLQKERLVEVRERGTDAPLGEWLRCGPVGGRTRVVDLAQGSGHALLAYTSGIGTKRGPEPTVLMRCRLDRGETSGSFRFGGGPDAGSRSWWVPSRGWGALSRDGGNVVVVDGLENRLEIREGATGERLHEIEAEDRLSSVAVQAEEGPLILGTRGGAVGSYDVRTGRLVERRVLFDQEGVTALAVAEVGGLVVAGGERGTLRLWDRRTGEVPVTLHGHRSAITALELSQRGLRLLSASADGTLRTWRLTGSSRNPQRLRFPGKDVLSLDFSSGGQALAAAGRDGGVWLWEARRGGGGRVLLPAQGPYPLSVDFSPDRARLAVSMNEGMVLLVDAGNGEVLVRRPLADRGFTHLAWRPDGTALAHCSGGGVLILATETLEVRQRLDGLRAPCAWSPDGQVLAALDAEGRLVVLESEGGEPRVLEPLPGEARATDLAWGPQGDRLVLALTGRSRDESGPVGLRVYHPDTLGLRPRHVPAAAGVRSLAWHPRQPRVAVALEDGRIGLYDARTWTALLHLSGHTAGVYDVDWSPDGSVLASAAADGTAMLWWAPGNPAPRPGNGSLPAPR